MSDFRKVTIRAYVEADRPYVLALLRELQAYEVPLRKQRLRSEDVSEDYYRHEYDELMGDPECDAMFLVAELDGQIVGYVFCLVDTELLDDPREQIQVLDIMVTEKARGYGVGKQLMQAVDRFAAERSIDRISLTVLSSNNDAISFYKTLGFDVAVLTMERIISS